MELFCDIYVDFHGDQNALEELVRGHMSTLSPRLIDAISVRRNEVRGDSRASKDAAWLNYLYCIEFEPESDSSSLHECADLISELVRLLRRAGHDAVPACDYEDRLPTDVVWSSRRELSKESPETA